MGLSGTLTASDSADGLSDGSYFTISNSSANGSASIDVASGVWSYTPTANYNGSDTFTITVTDDDGHTVSQVVSLTLTAVDDAATIAGDISSTGAEDTSLSGTLTASDDIDGLSDGSYFTVSTIATNGTASIIAETGVWSYTPTANYN